MRFLTFFILIASNVFSQTESAIRDETESMIQEAIDMDLKTGDYIAFNKLVDIDKSHLRHSIAKFKATDVSMIAHISLKLISERELYYFRALADSLNKTATDRITEENEYSLIRRHLGKEYCQFTKPIFSKNGKQGVIEFETFSGHAYGSRSVTYLMKKKKGKWTNKSILRMSSD